jgi:hypothetical protein
MTDETIPIGRKDKRDIRCFYLMNGQIIFAEYIDEDEDTDDIIIKRAVAVMIGPKQQIGMSTAFPFSDIDDKLQLGWRQVTTSSSLDWNESLRREYDNFWKAIAAKKLKDATGIEVVPAGTNIPPLRPVGRGPGVGPSASGGPIR